MINYPRISVVTPSLNQGQYLEDAIHSVTGQRYPNLEYIVIDGGSTDNSKAIIQNHSQHISFWCSERDLGQSHAINKGFMESTGDILCWLNSDDMFLPGTLFFVAQHINVTAPELIFGNCIHIAETGNGLYGSDVVTNHEFYKLELFDYLIQPSTFWTRSAWEEVGKLDEEMSYAFDWDWYIRAQKKAVTFRPQERYLAIYRKHPLQKTRLGGQERIQELASTYQNYAGPISVQLFFTLIKAPIRNRLLSRITKYINRATAFRLSYPRLSFRYGWRTIDAIFRMVPPHTYKTAPFQKIPDRSVEWNK